MQTFVLAVYLELAKPVSLLNGFALEGLSNYFVIFCGSARRSPATPYRPFKKCLVLVQTRKFL